MELGEIGGTGQVDAARDNGSHGRTKRVGMMVSSRTREERSEPKEPLRVKYSRTHGWQRPGATLLI